MFEDEVRARLPDHVVEALKIEFVEIRLFYDEGNAFLVISGRQVSNELGQLLSKGDWERRGGDLEFVDDSEHVAETCNFAVKLSLRIPLALDVNCVRFILGGNGRVDEVHSLSFVQH